MRASRREGGVGWPVGRKQQEGPQTVEAEGGARAERT